MGPLVTNGRGFSLIDVVLGSALLGFLVVVFVGAIGYGEEIARNAGARIGAAAIADESLEALRAIRAAAWNELVFTSSAIAPSGTKWGLLGEGTTATIGNYTQTLLFEDVCRDAAHQITSCPGSYTDIDTRKVTATVEWATRPGIIQALQRTTYISNWGAALWTQTNWSVGAGQALWSNPARYESDDGGVDVSTTGEVRLALGGAGPTEGWFPLSGQTLTDTTDTDFSQGVFAGTQVAGVGVPASVLLAQGTLWAEHADSEVAASGKTLEGTSAVAMSDVWSVGQSGKIIHYNGANWTEHTDLGAMTLYGVDFASPADGWTVGESGAIFHYNGAAWSQSGANVFTDTTDSDFGLGTFVNTEVVGAGIPADVELTKSLMWVEHPDSRIATGVTLNALDGTAPNDVWAVGNSGVFIRYDGTAWSLFLDVGNTSLNGLDMVSTSDGWAVGQSGQLYRFNGTTWALFVDTGATEWNGVSMAAASFGAVVGRQGNIRHFDGSAWTSISSPTTNHLNGVHLRTATDGWAVGDSGTILRWNGVSWTSISSPTGNRLRSVSMVSATDGWAAGDSGTLIHYDGTSWTIVSNPAGDQLNDVGMVTGSDGWSVGNTGVLMHWNGVSWSSVSSPTGGAALQSVFMSDAGSGWIVGSGGRILQYGLFYNTSGTFTSRAIDSGISGTTWSSISWTEILPTGADITLATRTSEDGVIWTTWSVELTVSGSTIQSVPGRFIEYRATLLRGSNPSATPELGNVSVSTSASVPPTTQTLFAVDALSVSEVWAVGGGGVIVHYNGTNWTSSASPTGLTLRSLAILSATDGWAVGNSGTIIHWDGVSWTLFSSPTGNTLNGIDMLSATDGWAVGNSGTIIHWDGVSWTTYAPSPTGDQLNSVALVSASAAWAVGNAGVTLRYDGATWSAESSPANNHLNAVVLISSGDGWAVGQGGRIFQYSQFYVTAGTFLSRILDSGVPGTAWNSAFWTEVLSPGSDLTIATRTGNTPVPDASWSAFSGEITTSVNNNLASPPGRYLEYRLTLTRGASAAETPELKDITIEFGVATLATLNDISVVTADDIWAVGNSGTIIHWDGVRWSAFPSPTGVALQGVSMISATAGFAVGDGGTIIRWDGSAWTSYLPSPTGSRLNGIDMVSATEGWAVGDSGTILRWNGVSWALAPSPVSDMLNDVHMRTESDGRAVGLSGKILLYNGASWVQEQDTGAEAWRDVFMVAPSDGWVVRNNGVLCRHAGGLWNACVDTGAQTWNGVYLVSASDGWVVGSGGEIRRFNGVSWNAVTSPTSETLNAVEMITANSGWAVGENGTILRYTTGFRYLFAGSLLSSAFNMGNPGAVQRIEWAERIPLCAPSCTVRFQVRTAPDAAGVPGVWSLWYGALGPGTFFTNSSGTLIPPALNGNQWIQYQLFLDGDGFETPALEEVRIEYR
ncbi:MAG: hypothetical protein Q8R39_02730 [bacterium]|nr:hypothetical protein [bacterium]MDZ4284476.1 hypothetical protein [Patescibacteria group bacterium]